MNAVQCRILIIALSFIAAQAGANVIYKANWKPAYTSEVVRAPAPANVQARVDAFAGRNSPESIKLLADEFFGMMNLDYERLPPEIRERYRGGNYAGALQAYRDFFVKRLRISPAGYPLGSSLDLGARPFAPLPPGSRLFMQYLATSDELMSNIVVFAMKDKDGKEVSLRMDRGEPGCFNWTWVPEGYAQGGYGGLPSDPATMMGGIMGNEDFFSDLLVSYLSTRNKAYLEKWCAFTDDRCLNWRRDLVEAKIKVQTDWHYHLEILSHSLWLNMAYIARSMPDFERDLSPYTLARLLVDMWKTYVPLCIRGARQDGANRRIGMKGCELWYTARFFPEFRPADYCVREFRRLGESWPYFTMLPDGTTPDELTLNYYLVWPLAVTEFINGLLVSRPIPEWLTAEWLREIHDSLDLKVRYSFHEFMNDGGWFNDGGFPGHTDEWLNAGEYPRFLKFFPPESQADPDLTAILYTVFGDGSRGLPSFNSEYFPYGGYALLRSGWSTTNDVQLFVHNNPYPQLGDNLGINLTAYGRDILASMWRTPLSTDGATHLHMYGTMQAYRSQNQDKFIKWRDDFYGRIRPQPNRWHTSANFDLYEAFYSEPFFTKSTPSAWTPEWKTMLKTPQNFITDVTHHRQIMFLREPRLFVVTDRALSTNQHNYRLNWPFTAPYVTGKIEVVQNVIRTLNPGVPNLAIHHFGPALREADPKKAVIKMDAEGCGFSATGDHVMVSLLCPLRVNENEMVTTKPLSSAVPGICGFEAVARDNTRIFYQAAPKPAHLRIGKLEARAENLLLTVSPSGARRGLALGCSEIKLGGKKADLPCADFEFSVVLSEPSLILRRRSPALATVPIYQPLELVRIEPQTDCFVDQVEVNMAHPVPGVDIRYTLDGSDPTLNSPLYSKPLLLKQTTTVKARAFRKGVTGMTSTFAGTQFSAVMRAVYRKEKYRLPHSIAAKDVTAGFSACYYEGDWSLSALFLDPNKALKVGAVNELFDFGMKQTKGNYAFYYIGYLDIPADGVYNFYAPPETIYPISDAGYDLRVWVGQEEWYPATRMQNYGVWSVPLKKGLHKFHVIFVDQRPGQAQWQYPYVADECWKVWRGEKPALLISGPGLEKQPIPSKMLFR